MITTRNRLPVLPRALQSVYAQDYPNLEILVLDDASEDSTSDYIRSHHPDIHLFRFEENRGLIVARNLLMREAKGDYIVSLDDDAYFVNCDAISNVVRRMGSEPEIGVISFLVVQREDDVRERTVPEHYTRTFMGGAHSVRKKVIEGTGNYREFLFHQGEEADLALRLLDKGYRILHFPEATVVHEQSPVARDLSRITTYGARNALLRSWLSEPFPWWLLTTGNTAVKFLAFAIEHRRVHYMLKGFWAAIKALPQVTSLRRPVSSKAMRLYFALRRPIVTSAPQAQAVYQAPPSLLRSLFYPSGRL